MDAIIDKYNKIYQGTDPVVDAVKIFKKAK